jgi:Ni/Fe-hydrogenase subunit HybB-like protein
VFEFSNELNSLLWLIVALIAAIPLTVFLKSYLKVRSRRFLFLVAAFSLFRI